MFIKNYLKSRKKLTKSFYNIKEWWLDMLSESGIINEDILSLDLCTGLLL